MRCELRISLELPPSANVPRVQSFPIFAQSQRYPIRDAGEEWNEKRGREGRWEPLCPMKAEIDIAHDIVLYAHAQGRNGREVGRGRRW